MDINDVTLTLRKCIKRVYSNLGPGLLESVYEDALEYELKKAGLRVGRQVEIPILYDGVHLAHPLRIDMLVEDMVVVENKSVQELLPVHYKQVITYLKLTKLKVGYLVNYNVVDIFDGMHRIVEKFIDPN